MYGSITQKLEQLWMWKFQYLLFVLKRSYICHYVVCMTVPLNIQVYEYMACCIYWKEIYFSLDVIHHKTWWYNWFGFDACKFLHPSIGWIRTWMASGMFCLFVIWHALSLVSIKTTPRFYVDWVCLHAVVFQGCYTSVLKMPKDECFSHLLRVRFVASCGIPIKVLKNSAILCQPYFATNTLAVTKPLTFVISNKSLKLRTHVFSYTANILFFPDEFCDPINSGFAYFPVQGAVSIKNERIIILNIQ